MSLVQSCPYLRYPEMRKKKKALILYIFSMFTLCSALCGVTQGKAHFFLKILTVSGNVQRRKFAQQLLIKTNAALNDDR